MEASDWKEAPLSQLPALKQLINMGYEYLPPSEAQRLREHRTSDVVLTGILRKQIKNLNRIKYKGSERLFSEENVETAVQRLLEIRHDGTQRTNEAVYDLLTLGVTLEQSVEGNKRSFPFRYIDWRDPSNNVYHVTAEFPVSKAKSDSTRRPDIVLFVNGIPFAVIECKSPDVDLVEGVSQSIRNQRKDEIPSLFPYVQVLMAVNMNGAKYATVGTPSKFWAIWKERDQKYTDADVERTINRSLSEESKNLLLDDPFKRCRDDFEEKEKAGPRLVTMQDRAIHHILNPARLIELTYFYTVYDAGVKKIARYQQYHTVKETLERIKTYDENGTRRGGIVWHTQGSGKSITMVILARAIALDPDIPGARIVLVTDRVDLDDQLANTFKACGLEPKSPATGKELLKTLEENKTKIITTLIQKFTKALNARKVILDSPDYFLLVDESHRSHYGALAARLRKVFSKGCYLGFTGTPLMKKEKNSFERFGGLIFPYTIRQAVEDKAVVPLLYEGRSVVHELDQKAMDLWFERLTSGLNERQKGDLKRKFSRTEALNNADRVVYMQAFDISKHYAQSWKNTGFKAQLVVKYRKTAVKMKRYLDEIGLVSSEVVISKPGTPVMYDDPNEDFLEKTTSDVEEFWNVMMDRYGTEAEYNKQIKNRFKNADDPEILIVADKLITGFDEPRNTVLYLCRSLREHTLLQAIARVNRLFYDENKDSEKEFGFIIDYAGVLGELDHALTAYDELAGYDETDLQGMLTSIREEVDKLPQRHSDIWDMFKELPNKTDAEAFERLLSDKERRDDFYGRFRRYARNLDIALATDRFVAETSVEAIDRYKRDLSWFAKLRVAVQTRYADTINYSDFEPKIRQLLDKHLGAQEVVRFNEPVDIFDDVKFAQVKETHGVVGGATPAAKADAIAHATMKTIHEKRDEDEVFYDRFSKQIQDAIDAYWNKRISELEYLERVTDIRNKVVREEHENAPERLRNHAHGLALYGLFQESLSEEVSVEAALAIEEIFMISSKVNFWDDRDAQKEVENQIEDYLLDDLRDSFDVELQLDRVDDLLEKIMRQAERRSGS